MFFNENSLLPFNGYLDPVTAIAGSTLVGGIMGNEAAGKASRAQGRASAASIAEQRRQADRTYGDAAPYRAVGKESLYSLADMMGVGYDNPYDEEISALEKKIGSTSNIPKSGRFSTLASEAGVIKSLPAEREKLQALREKQTAFANRQKYDFQESPGYQFRLGEGMKGLERSQSGRRLGGRAAKEALRYGQDYGSNEFGNAFSRLSTLAGYGPPTVGAGQPTGIPGTMERGGAAQAEAGFAGSAATSQAIQGGLGNYMQYQAYNQQGTGYGGTNVAGDAFMPAQM